MATNKTDIYVYAYWKGMLNPEIIGTISAHQAKGRKAFSFEYAKTWLTSKYQQILDPEIQFYSGTQYIHNKENFGIFLDSMQDTWERTRMNRRIAQQANERKEKATTLYDINFLLGVHYVSRMGGLRFKIDLAGLFLDDNDNMPTPPWSSIRDCNTQLTS